MTAAVASRDKLGRFVAYMPPEWADINEILDNASSTYLDRPDDFVADHARAFKIGGILVLEAINSSKDTGREQALHRPVVDIWEAAKDYLHNNLANPLFPENSGVEVGSISAFNSFLTVTKQARIRHKELRPAAKQLYQYYEGAYTPGVAAHAMHGVGFILHKWDIAWFTVSDNVAQTAVDNFEMADFLGPE